MNNTTIPAAVAHVNFLISRDIALGYVPTVEHWEQIKDNMNKAAESRTWMPYWYVEFGTQFGCRVTLAVQTANTDLGLRKDIKIGTSGNSRSIAESVALGKAVSGVAALAYEIEAYLSSVNPQPTPEAVQQEEKRIADDKARREQIAREIAAENAGKRRARAIKAAETRRINKEFKQGKNIKVKVG
jgi:hypothetical protein